MRILLIGGNGFIGSPLSRQLMAAGHSIAILHRSAGDALPKDRKHSRRPESETDSSHSPDVIVDLILSSGEQARQLTALLLRLHNASSRLAVWTCIARGACWTRANRGLSITEDSPVRTNRQLYPRETTRMMRSIFHRGG